MFDINDDLIIYTSELYDNLTKYFRGLELVNGNYPIKLVESILSDEPVHSNKNKEYLNFIMDNPDLKVFFKEVKYKLYLDDYLQIYLKTDIYNHIINLAKKHYNTFDFISSVWVEFNNTDKNNPTPFEDFHFYKYTTTSDDDTFPNISISLKSYAEKISFTANKNELFILLDKASVDKLVDKLKPKTQMNKLLFDKHSILKYYFNKVNLLDQYVQKDFIITCYVFYGYNIVNQDLNINKDKILKIKSLQDSDFGLRRVEDVKLIFSKITEIDYEIFKYKVNKKQDEFIIRVQDILNDIDSLFKAGKTGIPTRELSNFKFTHVLLDSALTSFKLKNK